MLKRAHIASYFVSHTFFSALAFAACTFVAAFALDLALSHIITHQHLHRLYAGFVVFLLSYGRAWMLRNKLAKIDAYQAHTYLQNVRMREAVLAIEAQQENCDHNFDSEHEQCRAFIRKQTQILKHTIGRGPDPVLIHGAVGVHPHCINVVHGKERCQHIVA